MRKFTKRSLAMQFIQLCDTIPLKDISVKRFLEFTEISKQTFYNYFKDKADLMNYAFEVAADSIIIDMDASLEGIYYGASQMAYVCLKHKDFYTQMAKYETQNSFSKCFAQNVEAVYHRKLVEAGFMTDFDAQKKQIVHYFCVGICTFFIDWICTGMKESPEDLANTIIECMPAGIRDALETKNAVGIDSAQLIC